MAKAEKLSIALTPELAELVRNAVGSGDYASSSEVIREALRDWKTKRLIGQLWDEGLASGSAPETETIDDIKAEARRGLSAKQAGA
ncbi:MAG: ribbon-helix-helix protein, CopG family [Rhodospirillales bacterium]|nr:ribbon-helix-helix protein, CopG family [Rhodospirillales bacterium]